MEKDFGDNLISSRTLLFYFVSLLYSTHSLSPSVSIKNQSGWWCRWQPFTTACGTVVPLHGWSWMLLSLSLLPPRPDGMETEWCLKPSTRYLVLLSRRLPFRYVVECCLCHKKAEADSTRCQMHQGYELQHSSHIYSFLGLLPLSGCLIAIPHHRVLYEVAKDRAHYYFFLPAECFPPSRSSPHASLHQILGLPARGNTVLPAKFDKSDISRFE